MPQTFYQEEYLFNFMIFNNFISFYSYIEHFYIEVI